jgi:NADPH-dependent 7-cyano-7-deazaguanine reductase QueF
LGVCSRTPVHISNVSNSENLHEIKQADFQNTLDLKATAIEFQTNCPVTPIPEFILYALQKG